MKKLVVLLGMLSLVTWMFLSGSAHAETLSEAKTNQDFATDEEYAIWKQKFGDEVNQEQSPATSEMMSLNVFNESLIGNEFLEYKVEGDGRYTMGTTGGNPATTTDNDKKLLFGHPSPWSSYTTLRLNGENIIFNPTTQSVNRENNQHISTMNIGNLTITQTLSLVKNNSTNRDDTVEVRYKVQNYSSQVNSLGVRIMMDTMLGDNDSAPFRIPGYGNMVNEFSLSGSNIPEYWQAFDSLTQPKVVAQGTLFSSEGEKPDQVLFTNWGGVYNSPWDYTIRPDYPTGDSAVSVYWNPITITPGETKEFITYYGLSELTQDLRPPLALSVSGISSIDVKDNAYHPNPFTVSSYVMNNGTATATDVNVKISLPQGLKLAPGEEETISIGNISVGQEKQVSWKVMIEPSTQNRNLAYNVHANASNTEPKIVTRNVEIPKLEEEKPTLVFVPGTMGSTLYNGSYSDKVWFSAFDEDVKKLNYSLYPNLLTRENETFFYGDFKGDFEELGYNVAVFTYDWRGDIRENARLLDDFISNQLKASKVDIVAHSQGGLIATQFANHHPQKIRKLINVGTPYYGSPKSLYMLMTGDLIPIIDKSLLIQSAKTMPAVHYMLPTKRYFNHDFYYEYLILQNDKKNLIQYKDFTNTKNILSTMLNSRLLDDFEDYQNQFNPTPPGVEVWNIVGDQIGTIGRVGKKETIRNMGSNLVWTEIYTVKTITGDETVPLLSANKGLGNNKERTFYYSGAKHSDQLKDKKVLEKIHYILSGQEDKGSKEFRTSYKKGKGLVLTINSPVDLHIYDTERNHSGPSSENPNLIENNIDRASYWTIDHNKFAYLQENNYEVLLDATDSGVFSFTIEQVIEDETDLKVYFKDIPITKGATVRAALDASNLEGMMLLLDKNNDHIVDEMIQPTFVGVGEAANDELGPDLAIDIQGNKGKGDWYTSDVMVKLAATDNEGGTGVNQVVYKVDHSGLQLYEDPIIFKTESKDPVQFQAIAEDNMGNYSHLIEASLKIDKTSPTITSELSDYYTVDTKLNLSSLVKVTDHVSGVSKVTYYINGKETEENIVVSDSGKQLVKIEAEDFAGNTAIFEKTIIGIIPAKITFNPEVINTKENKGNSVITVYIELLSKEAKLEDIQLDSIKLNGKVSPITDPKMGYVKNPIVDEDGDGKLEFMAKFNRSDVLPLLKAGTTASVEISGKLKNGAQFKGFTTVRVK